MPPTCNGSTTIESVSLLINNTRQMFLIVGSFPSCADPGTYVSSSRGFTIPLGLFTTCLQKVEQSGPRGKFYGPGQELASNSCAHNSTGKDLVTSKHLFPWNLTPELGRSSLSCTCTMWHCLDLPKDLWSLIPHPNYLASPLCQLGSDAWFLDFETTRVVEIPGPFPEEGGRTHGSFERMRHPYVRKEC